MSVRIISFKNVDGKLTKTVKHVDEPLDFSEPTFLVMRNQIEASKTPQERLARQEPTSSKAVP
jgi:hypothetical protein